MNKMFKTLLVVGALLIAPVIGRAATTTFIINGFTNAGIQPGSWTNLVNGGLKLTGMRFTTVSGAATNLPYYVLDAPLTNGNNLYFLRQGLSNAAYQGSASYATSYTVMVTNPWIHALNVAGVTISDFTGVTNAITYNSVMTVTTRVADAVSPWDLKFAGTAASNGVVTSVTLPADGLYFFRGLTLTNPVVPLLYQVAIDYESF